MKEAIREAQAVRLDQPAVETPVSAAKREQDGLYRVVVEGNPLVWIFDGAIWLASGKPGGGPAYDDGGWSPRLWGNSGRT